MPRNPLTLPDRHRCQCIRRDANFMSFGGDPREYRCAEKATHVIQEVNRGSDGRRGAMSVCDHCLSKALLQKDLHFTTTPVKGLKKIQCKLTIAERKKP